MQIRLIYATFLAMLLGLATGVGAESFDVLPTFDIEIGNDTSLGPNSSSNGSGMGIRDISTRRRVAYVTYDLTEVKALGVFFSNVRFSNYGHDLSNPVSVYGVLESQEGLVVSGVTWATGPGVQNSPLPTLDAPVALDFADLTGVLLTFTPPAQGVRAETETSEALADFLNSDTNGFVAFLFAPAAPGNQAIVRTLEMGAAGGTRLLGDIGGLATSASKPDPTDGATDIQRDVVLSWSAGAYAATHDVYLGTSFDDGNAASIGNPLGVLASPGQAATTFDPPGLLAFEQTYYWRIDEVNAAPDFKTFGGKVWSFTTEPFAYPIANVTATASTTSVAGSEPAKTVDGSGLVNGRHSITETHMWLGDAQAGDPVWIQFDFDGVYKVHEMHLWNYNGSYEYLLGLGLKDVTIEYTADGQTWTALGDYEFPRAPSAETYEGITIDMAGIAAQAVRFDIHSNRSTQLRYALGEVRFYYIPVYAREPRPASGVSAVDPEIDLSWRAGREAASHVVYFGADEQAVADTANPVDTVTASRFEPGSLILGQTYYWRVEEVNEAATPSRWPSDVWSFSTKEYYTVDDFESYTDNVDAGEAIFLTWLDGYDIAANGSVVSYENPPYAERGDVYNGNQAMPFFYTNTNGVVNSEAERTFSPTQDWTLNGADTLALHFKGDPVGLVVASESNIVMNGSGTDIWGTADQGHFVYKSLTGNGAIIAKVESLDNTNAWAKAGVMIRESLDPGAAWAYILSSTGNGVHYQARLSTGASATSDTSLTTLPAEQTSATAPVWVKLERVGNEFNGYYATDEAGTNWAPLIWNPQTITMTGTVYIGLAVTSHAAGVVTQAEFSGIATTGSVTGQWQSASLTVDQAYSGNGLDAFYVTIEDSSGRKKTVFNPDPYAVGAGAWRQWNIPLSDLSAGGVNTKSIKKMYLGIGDKTKPSRNASGRILIDDILFGRPALQQ
jgi:hypothetical protein